MRILRIIAHSFGPLCEAQLDLAPGLNVVGGPNEAGKSTWHAAIGAALTGVRRGKGRRGVAEQRFADLHRPWDSPEKWNVEVRLSLDDGRVIDLVQDLADKIASRATDIGMGRDVSAEIIYEGSPDASRWLGLDRDAFAATVWVDQGAVMAVATPESADLLQTYLQRAVASGTRDVTAAEALQRLEEFARIAVGSENASTRPLRTAEARLDAVSQALTSTRDQHAEYMRLLARAEQTRVALNNVTTNRRAMRAALMLADARLLQTRSARAIELTARYPTPPAGAVARDQLGDRVAAAVHAWKTRPSASPLSGPSSTEIATALGDLPAAPAGDVRPDAEVTRRYEDLVRAQGSLASVRSEPRATPGSGVERWNWLLLMLLIVLSAGAVVALVAGFSIVGAVALIGAAALAVRLLASRIADGRDASKLLAQRKESIANLTRAETALSAALEARGHKPSGNPPENDYRSYRAACEGRSDQAQRAARRDGLQDAYASREAAEAKQAEALKRTADAELAIRATALEACGAGAGSTEELVASLELWQTTRGTAAAESDHALGEWHELQSLLEGDSVSALSERAGHAIALARELSEGLPGEQISSIDGASATALAELERVESQRLREAEAAEARRQALADSMPDVAEAEEEFVVATEALQRIQSLASTVGTTIELLKAAEERVHRDLAPLLAAAIGRDLPFVTDGRYNEVAIDPANLTVQVKESATGQWREARFLSGGTREQIHLLLRTAMAEHLATTKESVPLVLDEVTGQSDETRTRELVSVLHRLSHDRQVILFTHDKNLLEWAEANLLPPQDRIIRVSFSSRLAETL